MRRPRADIRCGCENGSPKESSEIVGAPALDLDALLSNVNLRPIDAAVALGVSFHTIGTWRRRQVVPRGDHLCALARLVGVTAEEALAAVAPREEVRQ